MGDLDAALPPALTAIPVAAPDPEVPSESVESVIPEAVDPEAEAIFVAHADVSEPLEPTSDESAPHAAGSEQVKVDELVAAVDGLSERLRADQDVIGRMQSRIESLQGDQVRALLGPAITELANLHAAFVESADRDYERLGFDRVRKEFTLLGDRLESAIDVLGAVSIEARVGNPFDSRAHQAVKQVPTGDATLDKAIANVVRQGFTFDPEGKPVLYARVSVYAFDPALGPSTEVTTVADDRAVDSDPNPSSVAASSDASPISDDELELPYPLDHSEDS